MNGHINTYAHIQLHKKLEYITQYSQDNKYLSSKVTARSVKVCLETSDEDWDRESMRSLGASLKQGCV